MMTDTSALEPAEYLRRLFDDLPAGSGPGPYPGPWGVLFDLHVVETAHRAIDSHTAAGRVEKLAGDFSEAVPPAGTPTG